jgi:transcription antitermination factor NusG
VTSGTFEGYLGEIETLDPVRRRATVNLPVFSGQLPVELDVNELELAETNGSEQSSADQSPRPPG